ncbi:MAG TPA: hypothetical protein VKB86_01565 [Pyrinomonadaceae bacterium]|nr:hypothetical protein [Pyrinomonadaceae bacterium]
MFNIDTLLKFIPRSTLGNCKREQLMPLVKPLLHRFSKSSSRFWTAALFVVLLSIQVLAQTTTDVLPPPCDDSNYQNCAALQGTDPLKLNSPIIYSFPSDATLLAVFNNNQEAVDDFKSRARTAAQDWASRTGISISESPAGQAGNVTISASNSQTIRDAGAQVDIDHSDSSRRTITFSDDYMTWSSEGRDFTFSHEWGHVIGMSDVLPDDCSGVNTVMREAYSQQLVNGNSGAQPALNRPIRPTNCDLNKAKNIQEPGISYIFGGGGGGDTGGGDYYSYCTPYYWVWEQSDDNGKTWYIVDSWYAGCW